MPSVNVAMERSLRRSVMERFTDLLTASIRPAIGGRDAITDAQGKINDAKTAFSSWDNCMQAVYCKCVPPGRPARPSPLSFRFQSC
jgi:hypothetical protein